MTLWADSDTYLVRSWVVVHCPNHTSQSFTKRTAIIVYITTYQAARSQKQWLLMVATLVECTLFIVAYVFVTCLIHTLVYFHLPSQHQNVSVKLTACGNDSMTQKMILFQIDIVLSFLPFKVFWRGSMGSLGRVATTSYWCYKRLHSEWFSLFENLTDMLHQGRMGFFFKIHFCNGPVYLHFFPPDMEIYNIQTCVSGCPYQLYE